MNLKINRMLLCCVLCLFAIGITAQKKKGRTAPREITVPENIEYKVYQYRDGKFPRAGQMAVAYKEDGNTTKPVVVFIHGGGWANGDKDNVAYQVFNVAKQGFVGVSISYRLISEAPFPTCIKDVKEAIRFLKSKQGQLPIDVDRIGIWGYSAGAHLAAMIGLSPDSSFKTDTLQGYTSNVKALMLVSTPTDFIARRKNRGYLNWMSKEQNNDSKFLEEVSPITHIHKKQIPIYMLHGTADNIVKPFHYQKFGQRCEEVQVGNYRIFEFDEGNHMFYFKEGDKVKPIFQEFINSL